jgi:hypothetical protein
MRLSLDRPSVSEDRWFCSILYRQFIDGKRLSARLNRWLDCLHAFGRRHVAGSRLTRRH